MARKEAEELTSVTMRLDARTLARVDAHLKRLRAVSAIGVKVSRTDALRNLVESALSLDWGRTVKLVGSRE